MTETLLRRFRGIGIALVVLAMSAGAVFAAAPSLHPVSSQGAEEATETPEPTETPEATETPKPTETPEATDTPEPTETPEATQAPEAPGATQNPDTHGALVSTAAQMPTPAGFANHGAFVSCVAHMKDVTLATIDWTTVTPDACAAAHPGKSGGPHGHAGVNGKSGSHKPGG